MVERERNEKLGRFLEQARKEAGLSISDAAKIFKVSRQTVESWEKGLYGPKRERAVLVGKTYKVDPAKIDPFARPLNIIDTNNSESHKIPNIRLESINIKNVGDAREVEKAMRSAVKTMLAVSRDISHCFATTVADTALTPEYCPGDLCIADRAISPDDGDIVVVVFSGRPAILRRYQSRGVDTSGKMAFDLLATDPNFETLTANANNPAVILGTVIEHRRRIKKSVP